MAGLIQTGFVLYGVEDSPIDGVRDVIQFETVAGQFLIVGSEAHSAVSVYNITDPAAITQTARIELSPTSGTQVLSDLVWLPGNAFLTLGRYDDNYGLYTLGDDGRITSSASLSDGIGSYSGGFDGTAVAMPGYTQVYAANFGQEGFNVLRDTGSGFELVQDMGDNNYRKLGDVTALHHTSLHGQEMVFAGSAYDSGLHTFFLRGSGTLGQGDRVLPIDAGGFARITDIESAQIGERGFVIVGASQTDTLSVIRVSRNYVAEVVDVVMDTRDTRFEGVLDLEVFEAAGRTFVLAAGADDGVTLFELNYRGRLVHLETLADGFDTTLRNISSLDVRVEGSTAYAYVGSAAEAGVTELVINLARTGEVSMGDAVRDTLTGTGGDDVLWGRGQSDILNGRGGADRLIDGRGRDVLTGGKGADVFEFINDGRVDVITDFDWRRDKIDLSDYDFVNHFADLTIGARLKGGAIIAGGDKIFLETPDDTPFDVSRLTADNFIFG